VVVVQFESHNGSLHLPWVQTRARNSSQSLDGAVSV
jgi:hypothetical protein